MYFIEICLLFCTSNLVASLYSQVIMDLLLWVFAFAPHSFPANSQAAVDLCLTLLYSPVAYLHCILYVSYRDDPQCSQIIDKFGESEWSTGTYFID